MRAKCPKIFVYWEVPWPASMGFVSSGAHSLSRKAQCHIKRRIEKIISEEHARLQAEGMASESPFPEMMTNPLSLNNVPENFPVAF
jgi:hypothetical protein